MIRPLLWPLLAAFSLAVAPVSAQDNSLEKQAKKLHALAGGEMCEPLENAGEMEGSYESWTFSYTPELGGQVDDEEITLIRIWCMSGAYNVLHAYYTYRAYEGLMPLSFAVPNIRTPEDTEESRSADFGGVELLGMDGTTILTNSEFDPETRNITEHSLWRGVGDASSSGLWAFNDGEWTLVVYEVDASYDGQVNPHAIVDYRSGED